MRLPFPSSVRATGLLRRLHRDRRGAVIIEFALCGTAFIALLVACLTTALALFAQQCLQTTSDAMARQVLTGKAQLAGMTVSQFQSQACKSLPSFFDCSRVIVDLRRANDFSAADPSALSITFDANGKVSNTWRYDSVGPGDVVVLRIMYLWPVLAAPLGFNLANAGRDRRLLIGTQVFKAEAYS